MWLQVPSFFRWTLRPGAVLRFEHVTLRFNSLPMFGVAGAAEGSREPLAVIEFRNCRLETLLCNTGSPLMAIAAVPDASRIEEVRGAPHARMSESTLAQAAARATREHICRRCCSWRRATRRT